MILAKHFALCLKQFSKFGNQPNIQKHMDWSGGSLIIVIKFFSFENIGLS